MINSGFGRTFAALTPLALALCAGSSAFGQGATCATATPIVLGQSISGSTTGSPSYTNAGVCAGSGRPCQWFIYTAPPGGISINFSTCGSAGSLDTVVSAHSDCTTNSANVLACDDDGCNTNKSTITLNLVSNQVAYIRVAQFGNSGGAYTLAAAVPPPPPPPPVFGPDVTVYTCTDIGRYVLNPVGPITAYAVGTTSFNPGDYPLDWRDAGTSNKSPVIAQNIFKLKTGRFTQVGQSWLKHGFLSLNSPPDVGTGSCNTPPLGGDQLGTNCTDTYTSGNNSAQGNLGPRSAVNPTTGYYPPVVNSFTGGDAIYKRLQVSTSEMEQTTGPTATAKFFAEGHYVNYDDAIWNNGLNNSSWSPINLTSATATPTVSPTIRREPGIKAWGANDNTVVTVNADHTYTLTALGIDTGDLLSSGTRYTVLPTLPRDITCRYIVACKVTNNNNGTWHYEYCVYNHNSDRSGYSFSVHLPFDAVTSGEGMYFPLSHSGEPYTNTAWTADKSLVGMLTFKADNTFAGNPNANALRWGTMYTFWFDANVAPMAGQGKVTLFKPAYSGVDASGGASYPTGRTGDDLALAAYANGLQVPTYCPADIASAGGNPVPDGHTTVDDLTTFLAQFFAGNIAVADLATLGGGPGTAGDGQLTVDDLVFFLTAFFSACN